MNLRIFIIFILFHWSIKTSNAQTTEWISPMYASASGYTTLGIQGPPSNAIDASENTSWTLEAMGHIDFDLGRTNLVRGIEAYWGGHVSNGNTVNIYVDGVMVLTNQQFGSTRNIRYFPGIRGRHIRYQTVPLPHIPGSGQIATWSEVGNFRVFVETVPAAVSVSINRAIRLRWSSESGVIYQPQVSTDTIAWQDFGSSLIGTGNEMTLFFVSETPDKTFYRVNAR